MVEEGWHGVLEPEQSRKMPPWVGGTLVWEVSTQAGLAGYACGDSPQKVLESKGRSMKKASMSSRLASLMGCWSKQGKQRFHVKWKVRAQAW